MSILHDFKIHLPQLSSEEEWNNVINKHEGYLKKAVQVQARAYLLLNHLNEPQATFELMGWLNLWTKSVVALESAISAFQEGLNWVLQTTERATFEWWLHANSLLEPISKLVDLETSDDNGGIPDVTREYYQSEPVTRLQAYAAWCLCSDREHYNELLHPKTIAGIWDPNPAKEILADEKYRKFHESIYGTIEHEIDEEELKKSQKEWESSYREKKARIDKWLSDPQLKCWSDMIKKHSQTNKGTASFFNLFDSRATVAKELKKNDIRFGYSQYQKGSMAMHGSSMEQFIIIVDSVIAPKLNTAEVRDENLLEKITSNCNRTIVTLWQLITKHMHKDENFWVYAAEFYRMEYAGQSLSADCKKAEPAEEYVITTFNY